MSSTTRVVLSNSFIASTKAVPEEQFRFQNACLFEKKY